MSQTTTKDLEVQALLEAARKLDAAKQDLTNIAKLSAALEFNQKLWKIFQNDLVREENTLPLETQSMLYNIGQFIDKQTHLCLSKPQADILENLKKINLNLAKRPQAAQNTQQPQTANTANQPTTDEPARTLGDLTI